MLYILLSYLRYRIDKRSLIYSCKYSTDTYIALKYLTNKSYINRLRIFMKGVGRSLLQ